MPDLVDYDPETKSFSPTRTIHIESGWNEDRLRKFLEEHPGACIYSIISHKQGEHLIEIDGKPYVDIFGLHVYITKEVSWYPHEDVDERFNDDRYPDNISPELYDYFDK